MDMKKILQALDNASTKPVEGSNDMAKFLKVIYEGSAVVPSLSGYNTGFLEKIVVTNVAQQGVTPQQALQELKTRVGSQDPHTEAPSPEFVQKYLTRKLEEGANPHKVALPVQMAMQHYQKPAEKAKPRTRLIDKYFTEAQEAIEQRKEEKRALINQYASIIAERVLMKESSNPCWDGYKRVPGTKKYDPGSCEKVEGVVDERSVSQAQARTMAAAAHNPAFAKKVGISGKVAKEFNKADTGKKLNTLPKRVKKGMPVNEAEGTPEGVEHLTKELLQHIVQQVGTEGAHAIIKSLTWGDGAAKELLHLIVQDLEQDIDSMSENEIPDHSMGFTGGVGPGIQSAVAEGADLTGFNTGYLEKVASGAPGRWMCSPEDAKAELARRAGSEDPHTEPPQATKTSGYSKEYLLKAADPNRFGRFLISVEQAQALLRQMQE